MADKKETKVEETVTDLKDLKAATDKAAKADKSDDAPAADAPEADAATETTEPVQSTAPVERVVEKDEQGRSYGTGRRKDAVARVWIKKGTGKVIVNGRDQTVYFGRKTHQLILNQPFLIVDSVGHYDVTCTVKGGGLSGQAGAVRHGISRALEKFDPANRPALKKAGMMTRDARIVERKKVGKHKARRTKQWAKR